MKAKCHDLQMENDKLKKEKKATQSKHSKQGKFLKKFLL